MHVCIHTYYYKLVCVLLEDILQVFYRPYLSRMKAAGSSNISIGDFWRINASESRLYVPTN